MVSALTGCQASSSASSSGGGGKGGKLQAEYVLKKLGNPKSLHYVYMLFYGIDFQGDVAVVTFLQGLPVHHDTFCDNFDIGRYCF